jgi:hypothetical protein
MGYVVKYSTSNVNKTRRKGNVALGVSSEGYDKTATSGFYAGVPPVEGKHNFVRTPSTGDPNFYCVDDTELINFVNSIGGSVSNVTDATTYLAAQSDIMFTDTLPSNTITDGLVLDLDTRIKTSYPGSGTTLYDLSGEGNNGTLTNGPTFNNIGAIELDGVDDYISIPNPLSSQSNLDQEWTVMAWVNLTEKTAQTLVYGMNQHLYVVAWQGNNSILYLNGGVNDYYKYGGDLISPGRWSFVTFRFRNSDGLITIYKNLTNVTTSGPNKTSTPSGISSTLLLGHGMQGKLGGMLIYDRVLSEVELQQNYYQSPIVTDGLILALDGGNLVSYEQTGSTLYNLTDTSVSASIVNGAGSGNIISLDGTNDWIGVNNSVTSATLSPSVATFSIWFRANDTYSSGNTCSLISRGNYNNSGGFFIHMRNISGNCQVSATFSKSTTTSYQFEGTSNITLNPFGEWNNVTVSVDSSIKLYANGELLQTVSRSVSNIIYGNGTINTNGDTNLAILSSLGYAPTLDQGAGGTWRPYNGDFGNMFMYNRVLTPAEVLQNYNAQRNRFL